MKLTHLMTIFLAVGNLAYAQIKTENYGLDGRPMMWTEANDAQVKLGFILAIIRSSPLFQGDHIEVHELSRGFEISTSLIEYLKHVPNNKTGRSFRVERELGPFGDGFRLKMWYQNYRTLFQLVPNQFLSEPFGFDFYGIIRPRDPNFEISYTFSFCCKASSNPLSNISTLPELQQQRLQFIRETVIQFIGPIETSGY